MKRLSKNSFGKAQKWIENNARPLEKTLLKFHFGNGSTQQVLAELETFQNADGGFGNTIEPDLRTPHSSVLGTSIAFQILRILKANANEDSVKSAIEFILNNYNEKNRTWRIIPLAAENSPHAPWWNQAGREDYFEGFNLNPTAEILGCLYDYKTLVESDELIFDLTSKVLDELSNLQEIEMHDFLCCKRLFESENLDDTNKQKFQDELSRLVDSCILKNSSEWSGYGLKPLQIADSPDSPFIHNIQSLVEKNLDYEIKNQDVDGAWLPTWSWGDSYPDEWEKVKEEWRGVITLDKLLLLNRFGRIEN